MSNNRLIFISYRREDSADVTGRIYDRLSATFGRDAIFKDVDNIPLGVDFRKHLDQEVSQCQILLAVIGKGWVNAIDEHGKRRLENPADFVRIELESALKRGIPVIPLLVSNAVMPATSQLPESLADLAYRNGTIVGRDPDFHNHVDRLINGIQKLIEQSSQPETIKEPIKQPKASSVIATTTKAIELKSEKGVDYTKLQELLAAGEWKEADQETTDRMLKVIGKDSLYRVKQGDIESFPCDDLGTIDRLWVQYSGGRFGFSVQKKIWQEVGGKVDYGTNKKLGDRVGWRKGYDWLNYSDLTFNLDAPEGHLPRGLAGVWVGGVSCGVWSLGLSASSLSQRVLTCNI